MLTRRAVLAALAITACGVACGHTPDSAAVYEALFQNFGEAGTPHLVLEVPLDATAAIAASKDLLRDFPVRRTRYRAGDFGALPIRLLNHSEFLEVFDSSRGCEGNWAELRRRFPETPALLRLSAVRFKKDGSEASVLLQADSACFGGVMEKLRFAREGSTWRFMDSENLWRA